MSLETGKIKRAKKIIDTFLGYEIEEYIKVLGRDHPHEASECTIGDIEDAYNIISEWFWEED